MSRKSLICLLLAAAVCLSAAGCGKTKGCGDGENNGEHSVPGVEGSVMQLLYCSSDSFNPYTAATSINREVCKLLFEPLYRVDNSFSAQPALAAAAENSENTCRVTLKDAVFTDGSALTAADVVYSCNLAKNTAGAYAASMYEVVSVSAEGNKTVVFKLSKRDPYFLNLLDFPIIKANSDKVTDADGVSAPPIGCGRFRLNETGDGLLKNDSYYGVHPYIETVRLINAPDAESVSHYVEIGAADAYYTDIADGNIVRMSGKKADISLNNLVFIGINGSSPLLAQPELRYAISSALDRSAICKGAYYNNAAAATGFFHPGFTDTAAVQTLQNTADTKIALENLSKIGYNNLDTAGYRVNSSGKHVVLSMLINSENASRKAAAELCAAQLKNVGIELRITEKSYADYISALAAGSFELYIGEIRVPANMDITALVLPGGSAAYGVVEQKPSEEQTAGKKDGDNSAAAASGDTGNTGEPAAAEPAPALLSELYASYYAGTAGIGDIATALLTGLPCIPVCFRNGLLFYDSGVCDLSGASASDIFSGLSSGSPGK